MVILIILFLIFCNALLALAEIAVVTSDRFNLKAAAQQGDQRAEIVLQFKKEPGKFLSSVQVGITLIGILAGAISGVKLAATLSPLLEWTGVDTEWSYRISFSLVVVIITYLNILLGELVPKTLALQSPEKMALKMAYFIKYLSVIFSPVVFLLAVSTSSLSSWLGWSQPQDDTISEDYIRQLIRVANKQGVLENKETEMLQNLFRFANRRAHQIMTSSKETIWLDFDDPDQAEYLIVNTAHTKFPVKDNVTEKVIGYVNVKDYIEKRLENDSVHLKDVLTPPVFIQQEENAIQILERFSQKRNYFGVVLDKNQKVLGIITLHDLMEGIFGELPLPDEIIEPPVLIRENGSLLVNGNVLLDELMEFPMVGNIFTENERFDTIAHFLVQQLHHLPKGGEVLHKGHLTFEIMDVDGIEIDKVLIYSKKQA